MPSGPTVLICVGATKSGTSWLYDYLSGHPDCALRTVKELHYFDAIDFGFGWVKRGLRDGIARDRAALARLSPEAGEARQLRAKLADGQQVLDMIEAGSVDTDRYLGYLTENAGAARLVADITPAYAMLSGDRLAQMATMSPDVKVVFLMRDPVARLWSHVRMDAMNKTPKGEDIVKAARQLLNKILRKGDTDITPRGDYPAIVEKLRAAVPADRLYLAFYEEMLTQPGIDALCDFLCISRRRADLGRRVHEGAAITMNPGQINAARETLAPHYAYVQNLFGRLPDAWQANMARAS